MGKIIQLGVSNIARIRKNEPQHYDVVRFDSNNNCNVHCVYCHNSRSSELVDANQFQRFLDENVTSVDVFQVGCAMEPTLDTRMTDFMHMVSRSPAKPRSTFRLQTNGTLLHRHDYGKINDSGLTLLTLSLDTINPQILKQLRGGTSFTRVCDNLISFHENCPEVALSFVTTVTRLNINLLDDLIRFGLDCGVSQFEIRQAFYYPKNSVIDHTKMPDLLVSNDEFLCLKKRLLATYSGRTSLHIQEAQTLVNAGPKVRQDSLM